MAPNLKKKRYLLVVVLVVLGMLVGFLPFFLSAKPVLRFAVSKLNTRIQGSLTVDSWLIGWQQGVLCQNIIYTDPEKGVRVVVPRLTSTQGLLEMVFSQRNLGQIALDSPVIEFSDRQVKETSPNSPQVPTTDSGTPPADKAAPFWEKLTVQLEVRGGQVKVLSRNLAREAGIKDIVLHSFLQEGVVTFDAAFHMMNDQGSVDLAGTWNLPAHQSSFIDTLVTETQLTISSLQVKDFLSVGALKTNLPAGQGVLSGDIELKTTGIDNLEVSGAFDIVDLKLSGGLLGDDSPAFQKIHVDVDEASLSKLRWSLKQLEIDSDAGTLKAVSHHDSGKTTLSSQGKIMIPVLFDQFPHLLRLQESTLIETGDLYFDTELAVSKNVINIDLKGKIDSLGGFYEGQAFAWDKPVAVVLAGDRIGNEVNVSRFKIEAPFIQAAGKGNLSAFDLEATVDLDQTFAELGKLFRLQWTGSGYMNMAVNASAMSEDEDRYRINADFNVDDFSLSKEDRVVIPNNNLSLVGSGYAPVSMLKKGHGNVDLQFALSSWLGEIFLALDADKKTNGTWSGSYSTDTNINLSDFAAFLHHLEKLPSTTTLSGDLQLQAAGNFNDAYLGIRELETGISDFVLERDGIVFEDKNIQFGIERSVNDEVSSLVVHELVVAEDREEFIAGGAGATGINFRDHSLYLHNFTLASELGNTRIKRLLVGDWEKPLKELASNLTVSADLSGLTPLLHSTGLLSRNLQLAGLADIRLDAVDKDNEEHEIFSEVQLDNFGIKKEDKNILTDEDAEISAHLVGNFASKNFELKQLFLSSIPLDLDAHGSVIRSEDRNEFTVQGEFTPDLAAISSIVRNGFDLDVAMTGKSSETFAVRYPLGRLQGNDRKEKTSVSASIAADNIEYKGIDVQMLSLPIRFENSNLQMELAGKLNKGALNLMSDCDFRGEPPVVVIPENSKVLSDVQLEKPLVEGLLKGIHPIFGVLTQPAGKIDLRLDSFTWPLIKKGGNDAVFVAVIDTSEVNLDSSNMLKTILAGFGLEHEKLRLRDSNVVCSGQEGRIACSPIHILAADSEMVLSGSVGMDKSLDYLLQVPVTKKLVGKEGYRVLEGTTINVPIKGTTDTPVFDKNLLAAAIKDLVQQAASRALIDQAGKILPELLNDVLVPGEKR